MASRRDKQTPQSRETKTSKAGPTAEGFWEEALFFATAALLRAPKRRKPHPPSQKPPGKK
jgi:hypothetical protein